MHTPLLLYMQGKKQWGREEEEEEAQGHQRCDLPCRLMWQLCFLAEQWRGRVQSRAFNLTTSWSSDSWTDHRDRLRRVAAGPGREDGEEECCRPTPHTRLKMKPNPPPPPLRLSLCWSQLSLPVMARITLRASRVSSDGAKPRDLKRCWWDVPLRSYYPAPHCSKKRQPGDKQMHKKEVSYLYAILYWPLRDGWTDVWMRRRRRCRDAERRPGDRHKRRSLHHSSTHRRLWPKRLRPRSPVFTGIRLLYRMLVVMFTAVLPRFVAKRRLRQRPPPLLASRARDGQWEGGCADVRKAPPPLRGSANHDAGCLLHGSPTWCHWGMRRSPAHIKHLECLLTWSALLGES